jgi:heparan-alpha-glucosaminide N-acetyltransferase
MWRRDHDTTSGADLQRLSGKSMLGPKRNRTLRTGYRMNSPATRQEPPARLVSLDAYRGFVMICLAANGFGLFDTSKNFPNSTIWQAIGHQFDHVPWVGSVFWDLIQPSFMFMVGVSLPYSYTRRLEKEDSWNHCLLHAVIRSLVLILLGIFLSSAWSKETNFTFMNVLTQIGLGYTFLFLLWNRGVAIQVFVAAAILVGYWAWFALTPVAGTAFDYAKVGLPENWNYLTGFTAHWQKCANPAATFDQWFLNLFPRSEPFVFNKGGYQTLNFVPSLVTMLFGLMTGEFIRRSDDRKRTLTTLVACGLALLVVGYGLHAFGVCPLVKRIWTPSWTLYSTGLTLLMLAAFYGVIDVAGCRAIAFPLTVAGMNSIALYVMSQLLKNSTADALERHFGAGLFTIFGDHYIPLMKANLVLLVFWLFVWWLYRQRIFFRI